MGTAIGDRKRALRAVALMSALVMAVAAIGAPVSAAKTRMTIINGTPGKKLDVCVGGREIKKGLAYGEALKKTVNKPKATVKFYPRKAGKCKGALLGKKIVKPARSVIVRTKKKPGRVLLFREPKLPAPSAVVAYDVIGQGLNASELTRIDISVQRVDASGVAMGGVPLDKGDQRRVLDDQLGDTRQIATVRAFQRPETPVSDSIVTPIRSFRYYQWVLVGTTPEDTAIVATSRRIGLVEE